MVAALQGYAGNRAVARLIVQRSIEDDLRAAPVSAPAGGRVDIPADRSLMTVDGRRLLVPCRVYEIGQVPGTLDALSMNSDSRHEFLPGSLVERMEQASAQPNLSVGDVRRHALRSGGLSRVALAQWNGQLHLVGVDTVQVSGGEAHSGFVTTAPSSSGLGRTLLVGRLRALALRGAGVMRVEVGFSARTLRFHREIVAVGGIRVPAVAQNVHYVIEPVNAARLLVAWDRSLTAEQRISLQSLGQAGSATNEAVQAVLARGGPPRAGGGPGGGSGSGSGNAAGSAGAPDGSRPAGVGGSRGRRAQGDGAPGGQESGGFEHGSPVPARRTTVPVLGGTRDARHLTVAVPRPARGPGRIAPVGSATLPSAPIASTPIPSTPVSSTPLRRGPVRPGAVGTGAALLVGNEFLEHLGGLLAGAYMEHSQWYRNQAGSERAARAARQAAQWTAILRSVAARARAFAPAAPFARATVRIHHVPHRDDRYELRAVSPAVAAAPMSDEVIVRDRSLVVELIAGLLSGGDVPSTGEVVVTVAVTPP
jgi:hypothetical protein